MNPRTVLSLLGLALTIFELLSDNKQKSINN